MIRNNSCSTIHLKKTSWFFFLLILIFAFGATQVQADDGSLLSLVSPYKKALRHYTREGALYSIDNLDTKYKWYATYHSPNFLQASERLYEKHYPEGQNGYAAQRFKSLANDEQSEFFIALYAKERSLKRMDESKNLWNLVLLVDDKSIVPVIVEEIPITAFEYLFYPYVEKWYRIYRVVFPYQLSGSADFVLQLSSVRGVSELKFKL